MTPLKCLKTILKIVRRIGKTSLFAMGKLQKSKQEQAIPRNHDLELHRNLIRKRLSALKEWKNVKGEQRR